MELVTGFAGQAHVDPIDMAHVNAVAFGHDAYLLDTQNKLTCSRYWRSDDPGTSFYRCAIGRDRLAIWRKRPKT